MFMFKLAFAKNSQNYLGQKFAKFLLKSKFFFCNSQSTLSKNHWKSQNQKFYEGQSHKTFKA